jgi:peptidoglycan/xylan/chitin deacetylase (PgdA/CDA1 family)
MRQAQPRYYSALPPFRELFQTGVPILMYHKVGRRPRGARLKGLYVSPRLFAQQIGELREAGFVAASLGVIVGSEDNRDRRVVISFDDGFRNVLENALEPLAQNGFRAIQFLVANCLGKRNEWDVREGDVPEPVMDALQVRAWLAAGHAIGSHTLSHSRLPRLSLRDAQEEINASKKRLEDQFGVPVEHFCYPYGDWNEAVRDLVIEAGYRTACTTQFGVNSAATSPFALHRITARYPSRSLKTLTAGLARLKLR